MNQTCIEEGEFELGRVVAISVGDDVGLPVGKDESEGSWLRLSEGFEVMDGNELETGLGLIDKLGVFESN
jgi:hypothetical protein